MLNFEKRKTDYAENSDLYAPIWSLRNIRIQKQHSIGSLNNWSFAILSVCHRQIFLVCRSHSISRNSVLCTFYSSRQEKWTCLDEELLQHIRVELNDFTWFCIYGFKSPPKNTFFASFSRRRGEMSSSLFYNEHINGP